MSLPTLIMYDTIMHARRCVGEREYNVNSGPFVEGLRKECGFPSPRHGPWCAVFVSAMLRRAYAGRYRDCPIKLSRGAYRLGLNITKEGRQLFEPSPGFGVWRRKGWVLHRAAHIRIITGYDKETDTVHYIAGNERNRVVQKSLTGEEWRRGLLLLTTLADNQEVCK